MQTKILITLGYAIGVIRGASYYDISDELRAKLEKAEDKLDKALEEIMKEFANDKS